MSVRGPRDIKLIKSNFRLMYNNTINIVETKGIVKYILYDMISNFIDILVYYNKYILNE